MSLDVTRRVTLCRLLGLTDPPDLHPGSVVSLAAKPDRCAVRPHLAATLAYERTLAFRRRAGTPAA